MFITDLSYGHSFFISIASFHICIEQDLSRSFVLCSLAAYLTATLIRVAALYQLLRCLKLNLSGWSRLGGQIRNFFIAFIREGSCAVKIHIQNGGA